MTNIKKTIVALILLVFLTGCQGSYTLHIDENTFKEELTASEDDAAYFDFVEEYSGYSTRGAFEQAYNSNTTSLYDSQTFPELEEKVEGIPYYNKKYNATDSLLELKYSYAFTYDNYASSSIIQKFFPEFTMTEHVGYVELNTGDTCNVFYYYPKLKEIRITITTDFNVGLNNATKKDDNSYTWLISKDTINNRTLTRALFFNYEKGVIAANINWVLYIIIFVFALAIIGIIAIIFARSHEKKMKI